MGTNAAVGITGSFGTPSRQLGNEERYTSAGAAVRGVMRLCPQTAALNPRAPTVPKSSWRHRGAQGPPPVRSPDLTGRCEDQKSEGLAVYGPSIDDGVGANMLPASNGSCAPLGLALAPA